jgi:hypothetical protein
MNKPETLVMGVYFAVIACMTWLLTLASPWTGGVFVGLLVLGVLMYLGKPEEAK